MMQVSVDGYFEGPDRELDWGLVDEPLHQHFNDELGAMSAFLGGRVTWELMAAYWPTADADPSANAVEKEFAGIWRDMPKIVYSTTLERADWNTTIARSVVPADVLALKALPGGDMVLGGAELGAEFARLGLVDEYRLYVHPVVLGRGRPLFPSSDTPVGLTLLEARVFDNGVVLLRYQPAETSPHEPIPGG
jgi:dihydrofolate reductase